MRIENGMKFTNCVGLQDRDAVTGKVFDGNFLTCHDRPLNAGEDIMVSFRTFNYVGDNNVGNSIFRALEPFQEPEIVEQRYKNHFIVLEVYRMKNGLYYIWPFIQTGETASGTYTREGFNQRGGFESREQAIEAGIAAGKERIDDVYWPMI